MNGYWRGVVSHHSILDLFDIQTENADVGTVIEIFNFEILEPATIYNKDERTHDLKSGMATSTVPVKN